MLISISCNELIKDEVNCFCVCFRFFSFSVFILLIEVSKVDDIEDEWNRVEINNHNQILQDKSFAFGAVISLQFKQLNN